LNAGARPGAGRQRSGDGGGERIAIGIAGAEFEGEPDILEGEEPRQRRQARRLVDGVDAQRDGFGRATGSVAGGEGDTVLAGLIVRGGPVEQAADRIQRGAAGQVGG